MGHGGNCHPDHNLPTHPRSKCSVFKNLVKTNMDLHNSNLHRSRSVFCNTALPLWYYIAHFFSVIFNWLGKIGSEFVFSPQILTKLRHCFTCIYKNYSHETKGHPGRGERLKTWTPSKIKKFLFCQNFQFFFKTERKCVYLNTFQKMFNQSTSSPWNKIMSTSRKSSLFYIP